MKERRTEDAILDERLDVCGVIRTNGKTTLQTIWVCVIRSPYGEVVSHVDE